MAEGDQVRTSMRASSRRASSKRVSPSSKRISAKPSSSSKSRTSTSRASTSRASKSSASSRTSTSRISKSRKSTSRKSSSRIASSRTSSTRLTNSSEKTAWDTARPIIASWWTYSALVWAFLLTYVGQFFVNRFDKNKEKRERMTRSESAVANGEMFHGLISKLVLEANPFWRRTVKSDVPIDEIPTCVFMANHISFSDPFVLCGAVPECKAVGMSSLWDIPVVGSIFRNNGDMAVFFEKKPDGRWGTKPGSKEKLLDDAKGYLADGVPVAVFPEGAITPTGSLLPMKVGFFKLAMETGVPIVPIGMWGNQDAWPMDKPKKDGSSVPKYILGSADIQVHIGSPISTTEGLTLDELMAKVSGEINRLTRALPNYTLDIYNRDEGGEREASLSL